MNKFILSCMLAAAVSLTGCATVSQVAATVTSQAIKDSEALHCGAVGAPAAPLCFSDAQFQQINADLLKVSQGGLVYTQLVAQAATLKTTVGATVVSDFVKIISEALADISTILNSPSISVIVNDLKTVLAGL